MFDWVLNTHVAFLGCFSYRAMSVIIATSASCDQVIFEISLHMFFQYACVCFAKLKTEFRKITHSWQIKEITCLNERIFSVLLYLQVCFCLFLQKPHQSTNTYIYHGKGSTVGRRVCSNPDESFGYNDINHEGRKCFFKRRK